MNQIIMEIVAILIQCTIYKLAKNKMIPNPLVVIALLLACGLSMWLTSTAYGPIGLLVLSIALLYIEARLGDSVDSAYRKIKL